MTVTALPGIDVGEVISGFASFTNAMNSMRRLNLAEKELAENKRLSSARSGVLETEAEFNKFQNEWLSKALSGGNENERQMAIDLLSKGALTRSMRQQLGVAQQQIEMLNLGMQQHKNMMGFEKHMQGLVKQGVTEIYNTDMPSDLKITLGREMESTLTAQYQGKFDPASMRPAAFILQDVREAEEKERDRKLKETEAKDKRVEAFQIAEENRAEQTKIRAETRLEKTKVAGEERAEVVQVAADKRASAKAKVLKMGWPPEFSEKKKWEYGSLQEYELAMRNEAIDLPEIRAVQYEIKDQRVWGVEDETGLSIPKPYQKSGSKNMTLRRAQALGLEEEWLRADPVSKYQQLNVAPQVPINLNELNLEALR